MVSWTIGPYRFETVWTGRATGLPAAAVMLAATAGSAACAVGLVLLGADGAMGALTAAAAALLAVGALLCLAEAMATVLVAVRISVDSVQIRPGLLPLGGSRVPISSIRTVGVIDVQAMPLSSRGWWWTPGPPRGALIRCGPALALGLADGRQVLVSVNEPETAVWVIRRIGLPDIS